jgi:hypothetical protein
MENNDPFSIIDRLIDYTIGLESLYLHEKEPKRKNLSRRLAALLGDVGEENEYGEVVSQFYGIRSDIVHGTPLDDKKADYLCDNIYKYGDYLRKSILAFLDLNMKHQTKKVVLRMMDEHTRTVELRKVLQGSLRLLNWLRDS